MVVKLVLEFNPSPQYSNVYSRKYTLIVQKYNPTLCVSSPLPFMFVIYYLDSFSSSFDYLGYQFSDVLS